MDFKKLREIRRILRNHPPRLVHLKVDARGRIVLPARVRRDLGIEPGSSLTLVMDPFEMRLVAYDHALRRAKEYFREYGRTGRVSDELIFERRVEVLAEDLDYEDAGRLRAWAFDQTARARRSA